MTNVAIGIDIAKDKLDLATIDRQSGRPLDERSGANTAAGHAGVVAFARTYDHVHLIMEATGTYHLALAKALSEAGLLYSVINPLQLKRFAQMKLRRLKTDRSDAQLLAAYGREQRPPKHTPQPALEQQIKQISTHRRQLVKQRTALKNLAHASRYLPEAVPVCTEVCEHAIRHLEQGIARLDAALRARVTKAYAQVNRLIESVVGVGPRTATTLIAYVGSLDRYQSYKQIVAYAGLNPVPKQSGTSLNARMHISKQGQAELRTLFYVCALSARRYNKVCRAMYDRMRAAGKPKKVALIAVANKLIKQVFTAVKTGVEFDNDYQEKKPS